MILYNNRYRGPFEYEKFILNILGFHNIITELELFEIYGDDKSVDSLKDIKAKVDTLFNDYTKKDGYCDKCYLEILKGKENLRK